MSTPTLERPRASIPATGRIATLREHLGSLFPQATAVPLTRANWLWATAVVVIGTAISLARTTGAGPFQTIWEEDARDLLTDALNQPAAFNIIKPAVGYFLVGSRLMAEIAALFPISWAAAVLSIQAAIVAALLTLAVYIASGTHLQHKLARFLVAAPMLFSPTAENIVSEIYNRPATIQFFLAYAVFWLILWVPATRTGRIVQITTIALAVLSTFLLVIYIPLALLRWWTRRDRISLTLTATLILGAATQISALVVGLTDRSFTTPRYEPLWAIKSYIWWAVPHSVLGYKITWQIGDDIRWDQLLTVGLAWAIVAAAAVLALMKVTRPKWWLAIVAAAHSVGLCSMTIMSNGTITQRYLLPVEMLLFTALVALLIPADWRKGSLSQAPLIALTCIVLVVSASNYRHHHTWRHGGPLWTEQIRQAAVSCQASERREVVVRSGLEPNNSVVAVPCHIFRTKRWCEPPFCVNVGMGREAVALPRDREG